jgi:putative PIN family toxin of toxin-antitoxin system
MVGKVINVVLDTNVLISGVAFGGKPREILDLLINKEIVGVISPILLAELEEVLYKKFKYPKSRVLQVDKKMKKILRVVHPVKSIKIVRDDDDNRVLEAAVEGKCGYIVTGDEDLLVLKKYKAIKIMTPAEFLEEV